MEASSKAVSVLVDRTATPLLWLDTSILIAFARAEKRGGADPRIATLAELVEAKVQAGKLLCLESEQSREVEGHPRASAIRQRLRRLSYNVWIRGRLELELFQAGEAMRAYLAGTREIRLFSRTFFREDPDQQLRSAIERGWFLTVDMDMHPDVIAGAKEAKDRTRDDLERLRQANRVVGRGYAEQLAVERSGFIDAQRSILARLINEMSSPLPDLTTLAAGWPLQRYLRTWGALGGTIERLTDFLQSEHFFCLPCNDIPARLYAQLLTSDRIVEPGDPMDIQHMAAALPMARWAVTDRSLARRVRMLGLDSDWGCSVHSLRSFDHLIQELEAA